MRTRKNTFRRQKSVSCTFENVEYSGGAGALVIPTCYPENVLERICDRALEGMHLEEICRLPGMPDFLTVNQWLAKDPYFQRQYVNAIRGRVFMLFDKLQDYADGKIQKEVEKIVKDKWGDPKVVSIKESLPVDQCKLIINTIQWQLEKLWPQIFGKPHQLAPDTGQQNDPVDQLLNEISNKGHQLPQASEKDQYRALYAHFKAQGMLNPDGSLKDDA